MTFFPSDSLQLTCNLTCNNLHLIYTASPYLFTNFTQYQKTVQLHKTHSSTITPQSPQSLFNFQLRVKKWYFMVTRKHSILLKSQTLTTPHLTRKQPTTFKLNTFSIVNTLRKDTKFTVQGPYFPSYNMDLQQDKTVYLKNTIIRWTDVTTRVNKATLVKVLKLLLFKVSPVVSTTRPSFNSTDNLDSTPTWSDFLLPLVKKHQPRWQLARTVSKTRRGHDWFHERPFLFLNKRPTLESKVDWIIQSTLFHAFLHYKSTVKQLVKRLANRRVAYSNKQPNSSQSITRTTPRVYKKPLTFITSHTQLDNLPINLVQPSMFNSVNLGVQAKTKSIFLNTTIVARKASYRATTHHCTPKISTKILTKNLNSLLFFDTLNSLNEFRKLTTHYNVTSNNSTPVWDLPSTNMYMVQKAHLFGGKLSRSWVRLHRHLYPTRPTNQFSFTGQSRWNVLLLKKANFSHNTTRYVQNKVASKTLSPLSLLQKLLIKRYEATYLTQTTPTTKLYRRVKRRTPRWLKFKTQMQKKFWFLTYNQFSNHLKANLYRDYFTPFDTPVEDDFTAKTVSVGTKVKQPNLSYKQPVYFFVKNWCLGKNRGLTYPRTQTVVLHQPATQQQFIFYPNLLPSQKTLVLNAPNSVRLSKSFYKTKFYLYSTHSTLFILPLHAFFYVSRLKTTVSDSTSQQFPLFKYRRYLHSFLYPNEIKRYILKRHKPNVASFGTTPYTTHRSIRTFQNYVHQYRRITALNLLTPTSSKFFKPYEDHSSIFSSPTFEEAHIKRVRFKPGYGRIWRRARSALQESLSLSFRYQHRLTAYLPKFYKLSKFQCLYGLEMRLGSILIYTHLVPDFEFSRYFIQNELIYINGYVAGDVGAVIVLNDFIQLIVSLKYYIANRWLTSWKVKKHLRLCKLSHAKYGNQSRKRLDKQVSHLLPAWLYQHKYNQYDVPNYLEVDYFTLSAFMIYDPFLMTDFNPTNSREFRVSIYKNYNWKYIT